MVYAVIILSIICLDLFTKRLISDKLYIEEKKKLIYNRLYLWHKKNKGFSYGKLSNKPNIVKLFSGIACAVLGFMLFGVLYKSKSSVLKLSFSMCFAGAFANFIDRVKNNKVTDFIFIKFKNAPIFNIADIFIFAGCVMFYIDYFRNKN